MSTKKGANKIPPSVQQGVRPPPGRCWIQEPDAHRGARPGGAPSAVLLVTTAFFEGLSVEQLWALETGLEATIKHDLEQSSASSVSSSSTSSVSLRRGLSPAVARSLDCVERLSAELRRALVAKLEAGPPHDMDELREGAKWHLPTVETSEKVPMQATIQDRPQTTRGPNLGAHEPLYTIGPGPAVPPPLKLIASLPAEQRRALMAKLEAGLPRDMDKLREGTKRHRSTVVEASEKDPPQATIQDRPQTTRDPNLGAFEPLYARWSGPALPPLSFIESLSAEQRRALIAKLEAGLPNDMDKLRNIA